MKFKAGDKVVLLNVTGRPTGTIIQVNYSDTYIPYKIQLDGVTEAEPNFHNPNSILWKSERNIMLQEDYHSDANPKNGLMEQFATGATRTASEDKLSYVKALSPLVLRRYVQYLDRHRKQADGTMREFDNWKQGIPPERYLDGLGRHFLALWLLMDGFEIHDDPGQETIDDVLCAIIFNAMGMLHGLLKNKKGD